jgi:hypothetical protein
MKNMENKQLTVNNIFAYLKGIDKIRVDESNFARWCLYFIFLSDSTRVAKN